MTKPTGKPKPAITNPDPASIHNSKVMDRIKAHKDGLAKAMARHEGGKKDLQDTMSSANAPVSLKSDIADRVTGEQAGESIRVTWDNVQAMQAKFQALQDYVYSLPPGSKAVRGFDERKFDRLVEEFSRHDHPPMKHPFQGTMFEGNTIRVGWDRARATYPFKDVITANGIAIEKNVSESVVITEDSYVYYDIVGSTATLSTSTVWPPVSSSTYVLVGYAKWNNTALRLQSWGQALFDCPIIRSADPYYFACSRLDDTTVAVSYTYFRYGHLLGNAINLGKLAEDDDVNVTIPAVDGTYWVYFEGSIGLGDAQGSFSLGCTALNTPVNQIFTNTYEGYREELCEVFVEGGVITSVMQIWPGHMPDIGHPPTGCFYCKWVGGLDFRVYNPFFRYGKTTGDATDFGEISPGDYISVSIPNAPLGKGYIIYFQALYSTSYTFSIEVVQDNILGIDQSDSGGSRAYREELCRVYTYAGVVVGVEQLWPGHRLSLNGVIP